MNGSTACGEAFPCHEGLIPAVREGAVECCIAVEEDIFNVHSKIVKFKEAQGCISQSRLYHRILFMGPE